MRKLLITVLAVFVLAASAPPCALSQNLDQRGISALGGNLLIGGYIAAGIELLDESADTVRGDNTHTRQAVLDDLSMFLTYEMTADLSMFVEAELEDSLFLDEDGLEIGSQLFSLERFYLEYEPNQYLRLRAGKLLTPVGIWNQIHAAPLVWTSSRPLTTELFYDTGTTGVQADTRWHSGRLDFALSAFGQATEQLDETHGPQRQGQAFGTRMQIGGEERWYFGTSYLHFKDRSEGRWETTVGSDFLLITDRWEFSSEFAFNRPDGAAAATWGAYAQAVFNAGHGFHPVLRYEYVDMDGISGSPLVFGVAYRGSGGSVWKLEGRVGAEDLGTGGNGILASWAKLY